MMNTRPRIVVALLDETQEFQKLQADDAHNAAMECGLDVEVVFAENNAILQIQQLHRLIQLPEPQRPRAILVQTVSGEGAERLARTAVRAGIGWVLVSRKVSYVDALRAEHPGVPVGRVSADHVAIGRLQGRQFRSLLPGGAGVVLYVQGPPDTWAAQGRLQGVQEALEGSAVELKVVEGQWTEASGEQAVQRWLRLRRLEAGRAVMVGCQNDQMAVGARRALRGVEAQLGRLPLTGVDGLPNGGQRLVGSGELSATVVVPSNTGPAIRSIAASLRTGQAMPAELLLTPRSFPEPERLVPRPNPGLERLG
jgi:inositol transport system substrate-binding protein